MEVGARQGKTPILVKDVPGTCVHQLEMDLILENRRDREMRHIFSI